MASPTTISTAPGIPADTAMGPGGPAVVPTATSVSGEDFRAVCGSFVTGVTVVTARSAAGAQGSTVNAFTSLSAEPPQVIVCLNKNSSTLRHLMAGGTFAVQMLAADQESTARLFASKRDDKLSETDWRPGRNGSPVLDGTMAVLECEVAETHNQATHVLVIGRVTRAESDPTKSPLVFFRSLLGTGEALQNMVTQ